MPKEIGIPRIKIGKKKTIKTLINEECLLLTQYLRGEKAEWKIRIVELTEN